jgi:putative Holliday junction resolvase
MIEDQSQACSGSAEAIPSAQGVLSLEAFGQVLGSRSGVRLIGVDVGTKTLGLALSDVSRMIASALETIRRTKFKADAARLLELSKAHGVGGFVVGLPLNLDGSHGPRSQSSRAFARNIADLSGRPVLLWDERLSTAEAERMLISADATCAGGQK